MRHERQVALLKRVADSGERHVGLFGTHSLVQPSSTYTDGDRFGREQRVLFRDGPVLMGLTSECAQPGSYLTGTFGGVPIAVVRQTDGSLRAMVNACRHRGAPVLAGRGEGLRRMSCPYHAWTYELDGALHSRPLADGAFDDVTIDCGLHAVAVAERYGLIFVRAGSTEPIDVEHFLGGAADDLESFDLAASVHVETRVSEWEMNWKLVLDTFTESYHIRTLHRESLFPTFDSTCSIFESFGSHLLNVGFRKDIHDELAKPEAEQSLLPYGTVQYFLLPSAMLCHQVDHLELWRFEPIDVRHTRVSTTVLANTGPLTARTDRYLRKNLDVLLEVTGQEDFPLMEQIQRNLDSGALPAVVYGRIEPALVHLHESIDAALAAGHLG
ncbi:MAG: aromatic ring-hydroxylating dioxygenase subunit alpha [Ilumatobacteraceae bacterium]